MAAPRKYDEEPRSTAGEPAVEPAGSGPNLHLLVTARAASLAG